MEFKRPGYVANKEDWNRLLMAQKVFMGDFLYILKLLTLIFAR